MIASDHLHGIDGIVVSKYISPIQSTNTTASKKVRVVGYLDDLEK